MKVLILNWRDPNHPLAGGAEISLLEHAKYWQKNNAEITWISSSFSNAKGKDNLDGVNIIRMGSHYTVHLLFILYWFSGKIRKDFDIVIDSFHFLPFFTPLYMRRVKRIALINEIAGKLWTYNLSFPLGIVGYLLEPFFFKLYKNSRFITSSESTKKDLLKMGIKNKNIEIIPHGVSLPKNLPKDPKEKKPTIIYCSRITKDKGINDAVVAFNKLQNEIKELQFWIVGKEEREGYFKQTLRANNVTSKNIKYFGFVSDKKKFELLRKSWILVHPSLKEGWGLNVIEANSVGTPAVGYNVEGLRDSIQDKQTGLLSKINNEDFAEKIALLIHNKKMYKRVSENAKKWSRKFSWEKSSKQSWKILKY